MRVSSATRQDASVQELQKRQAELARAQTQLTSGKRISQPSDDPTGAARAERALIEELRGQATLRSVEASRNAMTLAESGLGDAVELAQTAREALVAAGNGSYSASERSALAVQLRELRSQLLNVANQQDGAGAYLFGGQGAQSAPFVDAVGGVISGSTGGQISASASDRLPLSVDGEQVWLHARTGNGVFATDGGAANTGSAWVDAGRVTNPSMLQGVPYELSFSTTAAGALEYSVIDTSTGAAANDASGNPITAKPFTAGKAITDIPGLSFAISGKPAAGDTFSITPSTPDLSVFDSLDRALAVLENPDANSGQVMQAVQGGLRDMDQALGHFQSTRAMLGETLNRLDGVESRAGARILSAQTTRSTAEDLDMVQAVSEFSSQQTGYQAALQSYSMVQKLSLFNYISG